MTDLAMTEPERTDHDVGFRPLTRARGDVPADRQCLRCAATFRSAGFGERICKLCKTQASWKSDLPLATGGRRASEQPGSRPCRS